MSFLEDTARFLEEPTLFSDKPITKDVQRRKMAR